MQKNYRSTVYACFIGYICQAIVVNFTPLLFVTFRSTFGVTLAELSLLPLLGFSVQLLTDLLSARLVPRIGYRPCLVAAHLLCGLGLSLMALLPFVMPPLAGLLLASFFYNVGAGLIEVLISPVVESCPTKNKGAYMSLLHSFYCWGVVGTVSLSTLFFVLFGVSSWRILYLVWAIIPFVNTILFSRVPLFPIEGDGEHGGVAHLFKSPLFWIFFLLMVASGAAELTVSQWASSFAESALGVSKTVGDLLGATGFAAMMGIARTGYAKLENRLPMKRALLACALLCACGYVLISFSPYPILSLVGCMICGLSVGLFWPGTLSLAASRMHGGTAMFALLALAGDTGCTIGPSIAGFVSQALDGDLRRGLFVGIAFPIILFLGLLFLRKEKKKS